MMNETNLPVNIRKALAIFQNAGDEDGWMSEEEHQRLQAELRALGVQVLIPTDDNADDGDPVMDEHGRAFFEVSIHPFVEQIADKDGELVDGGRSNASGSVFSDEFGDTLDGYPEEMFRKGWSVSSWVREVGDDDDDDDDLDVDLDCVDDEVFPDYETAIIRAQELATKYRVEVDHRY